MLEYDRIDISKGTDVNKTDGPKECKLCHYWYFLTKTLVTVYILVMVTII